MNKEFEQDATTRPDWKELAGDVYNRKAKSFFTERGNVQYMDKGDIITAITEAMQIAYERGREGAGEFYLKWIERIDKDLVLKEQQLAEKDNINENLRTDRNNYRNLWEELREQLAEKEEELTTVINAFVVTNANLRNENAKLREEMEKLKGVS